MNQQHEHQQHHANDYKQCLVCYTDLTHPCVTPCRHNEVCGTCHLRLRHLHSDKRCPMCKQENQQIIVDYYEQVQTKQFDDYPLWGDELGADFVFRDDVGMFFPKEYYEAHVVSLFGYHCGVCNHYDGVSPDLDKPNPQQQLQQQQSRPRNKTDRTAVSPAKCLMNHLKNKHGLKLCEFCIEHKRDFVALLPRFTPAQLKSHMTNGDSAETGFRGHPECAFCRPKRFYDLTHLHMHLLRDHYKCHVCDAQGLPNQYFRDYSALEKHFDIKHFLCKHPQCMEGRFMVFENEIDLRGHELSVHGASSTGSTKIQLQFRVRREGYSGAGYENQTVPSEDDFQYGIDGEAFVPEGIPQQEGREGQPNQDLSHPQHVQRTAELRTLAAGIRAAQLAETAEEAFPSLPDTTGSQSEAIRMGWTGPGALQRLTRSGVVTNSVEQFPTLSSTIPTTTTSKSSVATKMRARGVSGGKPFTAMRNVAMGNASTARAMNEWSSQIATRPSTSNDRTLASASFVRSTSGTSLNRQSDLVENNFPSLGPASQTRSTYPTIVSKGGFQSSANAKKAPSITSNDFPSLGVASQTRASYRMQNTANGVDQRTATKAAAPSLNNHEMFPPPPKASTKSKNSVREKLLCDRKHAPGVKNNNMNRSHGMATVEEMKASLGLANYKDLKVLAKRFASDELTPDAFVDHAAALFDSGYADPDFWRFIPALLVSCPNQAAVGQALRYVDDLRAVQLASEAPTPQAPAVSWTAPNTASAAVNPSAASASAVSYYGSAVAQAPPQHAVRPVGVAIQPMVASRTSLSQQGNNNKNGSAWGVHSKSSSSLVRAKAPKISVAVAAVNQTPQSGTATAFMAKESKQQNHQNQGATIPGNSALSKSKKKKNKQSEELRALAFGK